MPYPCLFLNTLKHHKTFGILIFSGDLIQKETSGMKWVNGHYSESEDDFSEFFPKNPKPAYLSINNNKTFYNCMNLR